VNRLRLPELLALADRTVPDIPVAGLTLDSRAVQPGWVFCALRGHARHGIEFAAEAVARGAAAVIYEPPVPAAALSALAVPLLAIDGLGRRLSSIAGRLFAEPTPALHLIGITGTDGKTSCAHFTAQALSTAQRPAGFLGTIGYGLFGDLQTATHTTPDPIRVQALLAQMRAQGAAYAAMEVSSHALDQGRVDGVHFACAVLTNLTRDHLDYHGTVAAYAAAKARLFTELDVAARVLNADDAFGRELLQRTAARGPIAYGFGAEVMHAAGGWVQGRALQLDDAGLGIDLHTHRGDATLRARVLGRFNASNLMAACAALLALGFDLDDAVERLGRVDTVPGRMECFGGGAQQPLAVVDYAHTPFALESVLGALRAHTRGRLFCVFGCGGDRDTGKRPQMGAIAERLADVVIVTSDNPRSEVPEAIIADILAGCRQRERIQAVSDRAEAIHVALTAAGPGDVVLVAGKGHEDYQIIGSERRSFSDRAELRAWFGECA